MAAALGAADSVRSHRIGRNPRRSDSEVDATLQAQTARCAVAGSGDPVPRWNLGGSTSPA